MSSIFVAWTVAATIAAPSSATPVVEQPQWIVGPTPDVISRYYPEQARRDRLKGYVRLMCIVRDTGLVDQCIVTREQPGNAGFGRAAIEASQEFRLTPARVDGEIMNTTFEITFAFKPDR